MVKVLSGKETGKLYRDYLKIDELEKTDEVIELTVCDDIISFNTSFFLGLFEKSKDNLKTLCDFKRKYKFVCDDYIKKDIEDAMDILYRFD